MLILNLILLSFSNNIVFFTGGSNRISKFIYSDFIKELENREFNINSYNDYSFDNNDILIGHSSGCIPLLNNCNNVSKIILLDPVKTFTYKNINLKHLDKILIINAGKSYKWSIFPPFIPFIPVFKLNIENLDIDKNKIQEINFKDFGHTDIINLPYRNIMHYSRISKGINKRDFKTINQYHIMLSLIIENFILN